jgi:hypothetical protein
MAQGSLGGPGFVEPPTIGVVTSRTMDPAPESPSRVALTEEQIAHIADLLRMGRRLPPHLLPHMFEVPREYELSYRGKLRRADVVADTMAVPLQPAKTFGSGSKGWTNMLVFGDNLQVLKTLIRSREEGLLRNEDGTSGIRLCYIDPPFATRREFLGSNRERAYLDKVAGAEFVEFLRRRLIMIHELLADDGSLYVHLDSRKVHYVKVVLDEIFGEGHFRNEIVWKRTVGTHGETKRYTAVHDTLLYYVKGPNPVWNDVRAEYTQQFLDRYYRYDDGDGRLYWRADLTGPGISRGETGKPWRGLDPSKKGRHWSKPPAELDRLDSEEKIYWPPGGTGWPQEKRYRDNLKGKAATDVWDDVTRINPVASERVEFPTQKPKKLLKRIIEASTKPGDLVLDCFSGSGTTLVAATNAPSGPRRWIGVDSSKYAIYVAQSRLLKGDEGKEAASQFTLYNAGLYDFSALRDLPWEEYRAFVLELFQCRPHEELVAGVRFDGLLGDDRVLVYDFTPHPEAQIGSEFVQDVASRVKGRIGGRCFIIAPAVSVALYEDYSETEHTRFYFLRIPYSVIQELHRRAFVELRQPSSESLLNAASEAFGFEFMTLPLVEARYENEGNTLRVTVDRFASSALTAPDASEGVTDLAMVMIDYDYDGNLFQSDVVHFGDDLARGDWRFEIPAEKAGKALMVVFVDSAGNEHRLVKRPRDFHVLARSEVQARSQ